MNLELGAILFLAEYKRCMLVTRELCPRMGYCGQPDAYGVTAARFGIEIEIKRTMGDFINDSRKSHCRNRDLFLKKMPKFFYYLVPNKIKNKALKALPEWAGLLTMHENGVELISECPPNKESERLSIMECAKLARQMTVYATRVEEKMDASISEWKMGWEPYYWSYSI